jgi:MoaA/NifB/PqqE/SkfB family radical SAM enzyme
MSNFYCAAPWRGLHINIRGDVKTCCAGNPNMLGNINDLPIDAILNGEKLTEIRQTLQQGKEHPYCYNCLDRESKGGDSERSWHNNINEDFDNATAGDQYHYPTLIDVRWNSTCNLSCNYCGPNDSSKWAALKQLPVNNNTRKYYTDVCDFIERNYEHVKEVALVGGEPLLLPENERLLDVIPKDCIVTVITNLANPLESNRIFQKLAQRSRVGWSISFDSIGDRFEYVRYGADWQVMLHNLTLVKDLMKNQGHWGGIQAVYNLYNATRLYEFKKFAQDLGLTIKWQNLSYPSALDPRQYGVEVAELCARETQRVLDDLNIDQEESSLFQSALNTYQEIKTSKPMQLELLKKFVDQTETFHPDSKGKFAVLWPEIANLWH